MPRPAMCSTKSQADRSFVLCCVEVEVPYVGIRNQGNVWALGRLWREWILSEGDQSINIKNGSRTALNET